MRCITTPDGKGTKRKGEGPRRERGRKLGANRSCRMVGEDRGRARKKIRSKSLAVIEGMGSRETCTPRMKRKQNWEGRLTGKGEQRQGKKKSRKGNSGRSLSAKKSKVSRQGGLSSGSAR